MEQIYTVGLVLLGIGAGSYIGTKLMLRYPGTRTWLQNLAIKGYNYLDEHKEEVPLEYRELWECAYKACDHAVDAFADDELTWAEVKTLGLDVITAVAKVRKVLMV